MFENVSAFVSHLSHLRSIDHAACNAILVQRNITVPDAFTPSKSPEERDTVDSTLVGVTTGLVFDLVVCIGLLVFKPANPKLKFGVPVTAFMAVGTFGRLVEHIFGMVDYDTVCRGFLKL